jgi:TrmH family RNA methyltransferase
MDIVTSRRDALVRRFRQLCRDRSFRREQGEFVCDGTKLFAEALTARASVSAVLLKESGARPDPGLPENVPSAVLSDEVFTWVSPLENSPGPLFSVKIEPLPARSPERVIVLENLQDPGNVGTVLRTAAALGIDLVILTGECADPYNPKTVRSAMGALFRQPLSEMPLSALKDALDGWGLPLYGAALAPDARDVRTLRLAPAALAVGNEGHGLSEELLALCDEKIIIPMTPGSESLNAAVAASILMWETAR